MFPLLRRMLLVLTAMAAVGGIVIAGLSVAGLGWADPGSTETDRSVAPPPAGSPAPPVDGSDAVRVVEPGPGAPVVTDEAPPTDGGAVQVVVTYADWNDSESVLEVTGFVSGVVEDGGTCRLTAQSQAATATVETSGIADASTTSCGTLMIPGADLAPGTWDVVLSYESSRASGESLAASVEVTS